jgi:hypothetical protein
MSHAEKTMRTTVLLSGLVGLAILLAPAAAGGEEKMAPSEKTTPAAPPLSKPLMKDFIGLNGHFTFKPELYKQVSRLVRNYHNMMWDVKQPGDKITLPMCVNGVDWKRDVYGKWAKDGILETDICVQFAGFGPENEKYKALWEGKDQWAYDYGYAMAKAFSPSGAEKLCTSIEIGNEPGKKFDDALYVRIFMQMAKGIRAADPRVKILTCNTQAAPADDYTKSLQETFGSAEIKRCFDAINVHTYAFKPKEAGHSPWDRSYPEDPAIEYLKTIDAVIAWRDKEAPGKEVWITEFGWDACTPEAMKNRKDWALKLNWTGVTDLQQAQYLVRSIFAFATRDVRRAYVYYYDDTDEASVHGSAGLTRKFQPKMAFWAMKHLYETLGEYRFSRIVEQKAGNLYVYEFRHGASADQVVWVAWSPTNSGREQEMTLRGLPAKPAKVQRMPTQDGPAPEVEWKSTAAGEITLKVTESPVYVMMKK